MKQALRASVLGFVTLATLAVGGVTTAGAAGWTVHGTYGTPENCRADGILGQNQNRWTGFSCVDVPFQNSIIWELRVFIP
ncbi:hypothetical protein [Amycolatopsis antarctica]|nr:hypothetical protein [Amycolatopsis antarctica]